MVFELVAEFGDDADSGHCGGVAERAEGASEHVLGKLADQVNVFGASEAGMEAIEHLLEPGGALTAGDAPAAGFVGVKMHDAPRHIHHASVFVNDDHAARAEHRPGFGDSVVVHGDINFIGFEYGAGTATRNDGLELFASTDAAGN